MPVSRRTTEGLAHDVAAAYTRAEIRLLRLIVRHLQEGTASPQWAENKLAELQTLRSRAQRVVVGARDEAVGELAAALTRAYLRGQAEGQGDLDALGIDTDGLETRQAERSIAALVAAQSADMDRMTLPIVRAVTDAYRDAITRAVSGTLTGSATRLEDAQHALDDLARRGVTGFTDTAGRQWGLQTYVEMATRTATAQAAVTGHLDRLEDAGLPLVIVSDSPRECELCRKWEGKVLSRGAVPALMRNARTGAMEPVRVDGTVADATRGGLFHPNCTHNLSAYVPGATRRNDAGSDASGYAAQQEQRAMERKVREWKRREAVALTPEAERSARAKVREWQGRIRDHTARADLPRKRNRESLTAAR